MKAAKFGSSTAVRGIAATNWTETLGKYCKYVRQWWTMWMIDRIAGERSDILFIVWHRTMQAELFF
jgi:hypothetical protein